MDPARIGIIEDDPEIISSLSQAIWADPSLKHIKDIKINEYLFGASINPVSSAIAKDRNDLLIVDYELYEHLEDKDKYKHLNGFTFADEILNKCKLFQYNLPKTLLMSGRPHAEIGPTAVGYLNKPIFYGFIQKPFGFVEIMQKIKELLIRRRRYGVCGTGVYGKLIAAHLAEQDHVEEVVVFRGNRPIEKIYDAFAAHPSRGKLRISGSLEETVEQSEIVLICTDTPGHRISQRDDRFDLLNYSGPPISKIIERLQMSGVKPSALVCDISNPIGVLDTVLERKLGLDKEQITGSVSNDFWRVKDEIEREKVNGVSGTEIYSYLDSNYNFVCLHGQVIEAIQKPMQLLHNSPKESINQIAKKAFNDHKRAIIDMANREMIASREDEEPYVAAQILASKTLKAFASFNPTVKEFYTWVPLKDGKNKYGYVAMPARVSYLREGIRLEPDLDEVALNQIPKNVIKAMQEQKRVAEEFIKTGRVRLQRGES
jgi:hypothetical protein